MIIISAIGYVFVNMLVKSHFTYYFYWCSYGEKIRLSTSILHKQYWKLFPIGQRSIIITKKHTMYWSISESLILLSGTKILAAFIHFIFFLNHTCRVISSDKEQAWKLCTTDRWQLVTLKPNFVCRMRRRWHLQLDNELGTRLSDWITLARIKRQIDWKPWIDEPYPEE